MLHLDTEGSKRVLVKRLKTFYKRTMLNVNQVHESNSSSKIRATFDFLLVIDFEATCLTKKDPNFKYLHLNINYPLIYT